MSDILVENVTGLTFSYYTSNDETTSNLDDIRTGWNRNDHYENLRPGTDRSAEH